MSKDDRNVIQFFDLYLAHFDFLHAGEHTGISVFVIKNQRTPGNNITFSDFHQVYFHRLERELHYSLCCGQCYVSDTLNTLSTKALPKEPPLERF
jgi:hypothetical protein